MTAMPKRQRQTNPADLGPRQRVQNGTAVIDYRADPEKPHAPAIRAARAFCAHLQWRNAGWISEGAYQAAERILTAAEVCSGAKPGGGASVHGAAFWQVGGMTASAMTAALYLRQLRETLGPTWAMVVLEFVVDGKPAPRVAGGLEAMAEFWQV
jgi:hypothetical protein